MKAHLQCGFGHFLTGTEQCHLQNSGRFKIKTQRYFVSQSTVSRGDWLRKLANIKDENKCATVYVGNSLNNYVQSYVFCSQNNGD